MRQKRIQLAAVVAVVAIASVATVAVAGGGKQIREKLTGDQEVPVVLTGAEGKFKAKISSDRVDYELQYEDLEGTITQAHIHIGQRLANGGIARVAVRHHDQPRPRGHAGLSGQPAERSPDSFTAADVVDTAASAGHRGR